MNLSRRRLLTLGVVSAAGIVLSGANSVRARWGESGNLSRHRLGDREYLLQLPKGMARIDKPLPVVLLFHGGGGRARAFARYSGFEDLCNRAGFIGVYPQGKDKHWQDARFRGRLSGPGVVGDVGFVQRLLDRVLAQNPGDPKRIYAMGMSNGAIFSQELALRIPDRLAAVASVCGQLPVTLVDGFNPRAPVSVLLMNGTRDPVVPYRGGEVRVSLFGREGKGRGRVAGTQQNLDLWIRHNGLGDRAQRTELPDRVPDDGCRVIYKRWGRHGGGSAVELYRIEGGGHAIPGRKQYLPKGLIGAACQDIDATSVIWRFFQAATS